MTGAVAGDNLVKEGKDSEDVQCTGLSHTYRTNIKCAGKNLTRIFQRRNCWLSECGPGEGIALRLVDWESQLHPV